MSLLSVVIPAHNEEKNIQRVIDRLTEVLEKEQIPFEMVFVDDGSRDGTWDRILEAHQTLEDVTAIRFSRNFGKEAAMLAGLEKAGGDCCVVIDCDLQHPPEKIPEMYRLWKQGFEVVEGVKRSRGHESVFHRLSARFFYFLMSRTAHIDMASASDFRLLDRKVVDALTALPERSPFFRALSSWVGFKSVKIEYDVEDRKEGTSNWSCLSLTRYAIRNIVSFSSIPLKMITWIGFFCLLITVVLGIQTVIRYFSGRAVEGFTTVILLLLLLGGLIMISLGIIGLYLAQMYEELKHRPLYLIDEYREKREPEQR